MILIRMAGNDYTVSRESVGKLLEASKPKRIWSIDVASMYPLPLIKWRPWIYYRSRMREEEKA